MHIPSYDDLVAIASQLTITLQRRAGQKDDHTSSLQGPWVLHDEQKKILQLIIEHRRILVLKSRQQGSSTVAVYALMMFAISNDNVQVALVADTADKSRGLLSKITNWLDQMGIEYTGNMSRVRLFNGTEIDALSAVSRAEGGESRVGRSRSYAMIVVSELSFIIDAAAVFRGLTSTALPGARIIVESTASSSEPNLFKTLWLLGEEGEEDDWYRHFISLEGHEAYRADPDTISDEKWLELQEDRFGFTRRDTAAWWWNKCRTDFAGDTIGCLREYPVHPRQCWLVIGGKFLSTTYAAEVSQTAPMINNRPVGWTHYVVDAPAEPLIVGVDVSAGLGGDAQALVIVGEHSRRIYATWLDHWCSQPKLIDLVKEVNTTWKPRKILLESNGKGLGVWLALSQHTNLPLVEQSSGNEKHFRMQLLKMFIEDGTIKLGPELQWEASHSRIAKPSGPKGAPWYESYDDCLSALSFANYWIENHGTKAIKVTPVTKINPQQVWHSTIAFANRKKKECF